VLISNQIIPQTICQVLREGMNDTQYDKLEIRTSHFGKFSTALGATRLIAQAVFGSPLLEILSI
jgi:hypothetical protein